jgi:hypothetical protein
VSLFERVAINVLLLKAADLDDEIEPSEQFSLFENISGQ